MYYLDAAGSTHGLSLDFSCLIQKLRWKDPPTQKIQTKTQQLYVNNNFFNRAFFTLHLLKNRNFF